MSKAAVMKRLVETHRQAFCFMPSSHNPQLPLSQDAYTLVDVGGADLREELRALSKMVR